MSAWLEKQNDGFLTLSIDMASVTEAGIRKSLAFSSFEKRRVTCIGFIHSIYGYLAPTDSHFLLNLSFENQLTNILNSIREQKINRRLTSQESDLLSIEALNQLISQQWTNRRKSQEDNIESGSSESSTPAHQCAFSNTIQRNLVKTSAWTEITVHF